MEDIKDIKPFIEMSNKELFCVLTGEYGVMAQYELQKMVKDFLKKHPDEEEISLHSVVEIYLNEEA